MTREDYEDLLPQHAKPEVRPPRARRKKRSKDPQVEIIIETDDYFAIQKPSGLSSISDRWNPDAVVVIDALWDLWKRSEPDAPRPHVVHRLDRETSGVMLFAKHADAQRELREQFRKREVSKTYFALTRGRPSPDAGRIEIQIQPHRKRAGAMEICRKDGKLCQTDYEVIEAFDGVSWVELHPVQGRTHQIRISLASIGTPCAVDSIYGRPEPLRLSEWKRSYRPGRDGVERPLCDRVTLHAGAIEFVEPTSGVRRRIEAPLPRDLSATLTQLRRWGRGRPGHGRLDREQEDQSRLDR